MRNEGDCLLGSAFPEYFCMEWIIFSSSAIFWFVKVQICQSISLISVKTILALSNINSFSGTISFFWKKLNTYSKSRLKIVNKNPNNGMKNNEDNFSILKGFPFWTKGLQSLWVSLSHFVLILWRCPVCVMSKITCFINNAYGNSLVCIIVKSGSLNRQTMSTYKYLKEGFDEDLNAHTDPFSVEIYLTFQIFFSWATTSLWNQSSSFFIFNDCWYYIFRW